MPRPKGSKNKKNTARAGDFDARIAEIQAALAALEEESSAAAAIIAEQNAKIRANKKSARALNREIASLEAKKAAISEAETAALKKQAVQEKINSLIAEGKSLDDIIDMLK